MQAVLGKIVSGVVVPTTMKPISSGVMPASRIAPSAAIFARSEVATPGPTMCRSRMPVRCRIHSSVVFDELLEVRVGQHAGGHVGREARDLHGAELPDFGGPADVVYHNLSLWGAVRPKYS